MCHLRRHLMLYSAPASFILPGARAYSLCVRHLDSPLPDYCTVRCQINSPPMEFSKNTCRCRISIFVPQSMSCLYLKSTSCPLNCFNFASYGTKPKLRLGKLNVTRKWKKLPYSLSLPKQPIYPYTGHVSFPHSVLLTRARE